MVVTAFLVGIALVAGFAIPLPTRGRSRRVRDSGTVLSSSDRHRRTAAAVGFAGFVTLTVACWPVLGAALTGHHESDISVSTPRLVVISAIGLTVLVANAALWRASRRKS